METDQYHPLRLRDESQMDEVMPSLSSKFSFCLPSPFLSHFFLLVLRTGTDPSSTGDDYDKVLDVAYMILPTSLDSS